MVKLSTGNVVTIMFDETGIGRLKGLTSSGIEIVQIIGKPLTIRIGSNFEYHGELKDALYLYDGVLGELRKENIVHLAIEIQAELIHIERELLRYGRGWTLTSIRLTSSNSVNVKVKVYASWVRADGVTYGRSGSGETYVVALENLIAAANGVVW